MLASLSAESEGAAALRVVGSGSGGVNELREKLAQDNIFFGLVRTTETIDQTVAVKFVAISFIGEAIGVMRKALISTLRGDITAAFDPFHCELLNVSTKEEVTNLTRTRTRSRIRARIRTRTDVSNKEEVTEEAVAQQP